jgi:hypothetical protein
MELIKGGLHNEISTSNGFDRYIPSIYLRCWIRCKTRSTEEKSINFSKTSSFSGLVFLFDVEVSDFLGEVL